MTLYLIRHGNGYNNTLEAYDYFRNHGLDVPLTPLGRRQATKLHRHVRRRWSTIDAGLLAPRRIHFDRIYSSPMRRCLETAVLVRRDLDAEIEVHPELYECGGLRLTTPAGEVFSASGMSAAQMTALDTRVTVPVAIGAGGWWNGQAETREQWDARADRLVAWIEELAGDATAEICLVTHAGISGVLLGRLLGCNEDGQPPVWFRLSNCGLTRIDIDAKTLRRNVQFHNSVDHLRPDEITGG